LQRVLSQLLALSSAAFLSLAANSASDLFKQAEKAEHAGDIFHAYLLYAQAASIEPSNVKFQARKNALAAATARLAAAGTSGTVEEQLAAGELSPAEISDLREAAPPPELKPATLKKSFDLRGNARDIVEQVGAAYGLQVEADRDYQNPPNFLFRTGEIGMREALRTLEDVTNSLIVPVNDHTVLLLRDNPTRRADTLPMMTKAIPIPERLSVQEAQEIVTAVQQTLEIRRIVADPGRHMVYVRDTVSKVNAARQLFAELSRSRAQVEVEIELLGVARSSSLNIGFALPTSTELEYFGSLLRGRAPAVSGNFIHYLTFGGGKTLFGFGVTNAEAFATLTRSSVETLLDAQIVTVDGQPGSMVVGDHYPIAANQYIGNTGNANNVYVPPVQVNYVDLGISVKVTPTVHDGGDMTLELETTYNVLGTGGANGIPDVGQRKYQGKVRVAKDEWVVVAGLMQETRSRTSTGIAWLADIPLIGHLFRQDTHTDQDSRFLVVLKPRLVNLPPWESPGHRLWVGSEGKPLSAY
jgi:general secretion pathway protein D